MTNYKNQVANKKNNDNTTTNLNVYSFANEAKAVAPLSTILGLYNVSLIDFCKKFDSLTENYAPGLKMYAKLTKKIKAKDFNLVIKPINVSVLIEIFLSHQYNSDDKELIDIVKYIKVELLFDLAKLYSGLHNLSLEISTKLILSKLSCYKNIKLII